MGQLSVCVWVEKDVGEWCSDFCILCFEISSVMLANQSINHTNQMEICVWDKFEFVKWNENLNEKRDESHKFWK